MELERIIKLPIGKKSFFLFGPRQTGKTTLIHKILQNKKTMEISLLHPDVYLKYKTRLNLFREEIEYFITQQSSGIVFIDEIQKIPELLDEIHFLIEKYKNKLSFILTGSSARKLKKVSTNLLAGRAWSYFLYPFTHVELKEHFSLSHVLQFGSLPAIFNLNKADTIQTLNAYAQTYLKEEILNEALIRNLTAFSRFLEIAGDSSSEIVNYSNIARETAIASKTIKEYYQILEDTLIAFHLEPYRKSRRKRIIEHPKYYFFDTGIINSLCGRLEMSLKSHTTLYGKLFEHFIILEIIRLIHYYNKSWKIYFWRTSQGAEVDLIIELNKNSLYAVEIKSSEYVSSKDLQGLKQFMELYPQSKAFCVCQAEKPYKQEKITILPWSYFFKKIEFSLVLIYFLLIPLQAYY